MDFFGHLIYPASFLSGHNPTEKEIDLAISNMTKTLEKKIKDFNILSSIS